MRLILRLGQGRQEQARENRNDGDYDQKFDERKRVAARLMHKKYKILKSFLAHRLKVKRSIAYSHLFTRSNDNHC